MGVPIVGLKINVDVDVDLRKEAIGIILCLLQMATRNVRSSAIQ